MFKVHESDKNRMLQALYTLNCTDTPLDALDVDSLIRYFAVHSFVNNYDSYLSIFVHNFYVHEQNGRLSLVPWDYNLGFGSFTYEAAVETVLGADSAFNAMPDTGDAMDVNKSMVNYPIDTPQYQAAMEDRPLLSALLSDPETLAQYHAVYDMLLSSCFENGKYPALLAQTADLIRPYIADGLTFYSTAQFEKGTAAMQLYCKYRTESVRGQLNGTIPATAAGQHSDYAALIEPEGLSLSDMADFSALAPILNDELISGVLHALLRDRFAYDTAGAVDAVHYYSDHPVSLIARIPALMQVKPVRALLLPIIMPWVCVGIFLILLIVILVKLQKRRKAA